MCMCFTQAQKCGDKLMVIIFVLFLAVTGLWITVEGLTGNAETFSDAEQRMLTGFPTEVTWDNLDSFADQVEDYINDHAPYRDELVAFNAGLDYHLFHSTDTPSVILGENGKTVQRTSGALGEGQKNGIRKRHIW